MDVNLKSVYLTSHFNLAAQEPMGISSILAESGLGYVGNPQGAYLARKVAVLSFTQTTAAIYAHRVVRLNAVVIHGLIDTPSVKILAEKYAEGDYKGYCQARSRQLLWVGWGVRGMLRRNAALFFASKEAGRITGQSDRIKYRKNIRAITNHAYITLDVSLLWDFSIGRRNCSKHFNDLDWKIKPSKSQCFRHGPTIRIS
jgi:NAD(P)-dependent dehydrogenase (short-subunit alcohol dehydrogenase family)